jgi:nuclear GTP-binding protein
MVTKKHVKPSKSKKMATHKKMKLERKVRKNKKKIRKQIKKMAKAGRLRKRDPNPLKEALRVPNMYPFKQQLIQQMTRKKNKERIAKKLKEKAQSTENPENAEILQKALVASQNVDGQEGVHAYDKNVTYDDNFNQNSGGLEIEGQDTLGFKSSEIKEDVEQYLHKPERNPKTKSFNRLIKKIFETADILLEVLDARDPQGCRALQLEKEFISKYPQKKLILILNKIDLVPLEVVNKWKRVLSNEYPTIPFKANLQQQRSNLSSTKVFSKSFETRKDLVNEITQSTKAVGTDKLLELLKNYSRYEGTNVKSAITVGVIGMPNVGKSSLINSLLRRKAAGVSSVPGHTRVLKEVELDSKVTIIDCPGVITGNEDETTLLLRNVIKTEDVQDLQKAVQVILGRIDKEFLLRFYRVADFYNYKEFLVNVGKAKGKFKKGGVVDLNLTARMIVQDWNNGKLNYYVHPPQNTSLMQPARIVRIEEPKSEKLQIE